MKIKLFLQFLLLFYSRTLFAYDQINISNWISNIPLWTEGQRAFEKDLNFAGYRKYYQLNFNESHYGKGYFITGNKKIFGQIFIVEPSKGTVILLHGYGYHSGILSQTIGFFLTNGFNTALFDLPGHGLSEGKRGNSEDFSEYGEDLVQFDAIVRQNCPAPYYFVGHSTGCAAFLEAAFRSESHFDKVVLCAPLVRSDTWDLSKFGYNVLSPFMKTVPGLFPEASHNKAIIEFIRGKDPLTVRDVPTRWVKALFDWNDKILSQPVLKDRILILQGTDDHIVDWKYNISYLVSKFTNSSVVYITNARHQLLNESPEYRNPVYSNILAEFNK